MSEKEFWASTPRYVAARLEACIQRERQEWERARFVSFHVIKTVDSKNKIKRLVDLWPFDWDEAATRPKFDNSPEAQAAFAAFSAEADLILEKMRHADPVQRSESNGRATQSLRGHDGKKRKADAGVRRKAARSKGAKSGPVG